MIKSERRLGPIPIMYPCGLILFVFSLLLFAYIFFHFNFLSSLLF